MATTTTNFGWDIPQSTDLVKDGATAIAGLGQDIDTSMADLKGGTSGQILSKASNTDMDFTWVSPNPGDITAVTAGTGLTGGGTSGDVTVSFDVANYGGGQYAAGKNKILNGDFGIWQRGISQNIGVGTYWADRWSQDMIAAVPVGTASQQTFTPGTAPVAGYESAYFGRVNITASSTCTNYWIYQKIEDVRTFAGQTVTLSAWIKADAATNIGAYLVQNFGSGGSAAVVTTLSASTAITNGWVRYSWTGSVPSISGKTVGTGSSLEIRFYFPLSGSYVRVGTYDFWGVQVEAGSTASPFQTATGTKQGELAACQRYYYRATGNSTSGSTMNFTGTASTTTISDCYITFPVTMRVNPSSIDYTNLGLYNVRSASSISGGTWTLQNGLPHAADVRYTHGSAVFTANDTSLMISATSATTYLGFNAEL